MKLCDYCGQWAQWRVSAPEKDANGKIVKWTTKAVLCGEHKKQMQAESEQSDPKPDLRFNFVGSIPDGVNYS